MSNCGSLGNKCPTSWANGVGATCSNGVCQPSTCISGWAFDMSARKCQNTVSDSNNWCVPYSLSPLTLQQDLELTPLARARSGSVGNRCSFPGGFGSCKNGQCTYDGCNDDCSFLGGICKKLDFNTDVENWCVALSPRLASPRLASSLSLAHASLPLLAAAARVASAASTTASRAARRASARSAGAPTAFCRRRAASSGGRRRRARRSPAAAALCVPLSIIFPDIESS